MMEGIYLIWSNHISPLYCVLGHKYPKFSSAEITSNIFGSVVLLFFERHYWGQSLHVGEDDQWSLSQSKRFKVLMRIFIPRLIIVLVEDCRLFQLDLITYHYSQTHFSESFSIIISGIIS